MSTNTPLLEQRNARICTNLMCDNCDYMDLVLEHCPVCHKETKLTTKQEEPPYVKCE